MKQNVFNLQQKGFLSNASKINVDMSTEKFHIFQAVLNMIHYTLHNVSAFKVRLTACISDFGKLDNVVYIQ